MCTKKEAYITDWILKGGKQWQRNHEHDWQNSSIWTLTKMVSIQGYSQIQTYHKLCIWLWLDTAFHCAMVPWIWNKFVKISHQYGQYTTKCILYTSVEELSDANPRNSNILNYGDYEDTPRVYIFQCIQRLVFMFFSPQQRK